MGRFYHDVRVKQASENLVVLVGFLDNVRNFKDVAIKDSMETLSQQENAHLEVDSLAGRYNELLRSAKRKLGLDENDHTDSVELSGNEDLSFIQDPVQFKNITKARDQFQESKQKYEQVCAALVDKVRLLVSA